jgi:hypothetical protein
LPSIKIKGTERSRPASRSGFSSWTCIDVRTSAPHQIHDRDRWREKSGRRAGADGSVVTRQLRTIDIRDKPTALTLPWRNGGGHGIEF